MNTVVKIVCTKYSIQVKFENDWQTMCEQTNKQTNHPPKPNQTKPKNINKQTAWCQDRSITPSLSAGLTRWRDLAAWYLMVTERIPVRKKMACKEHKKTKENMRNKAMARKAR